jgi:hypothetical protein
MTITATIGQQVRIMSGMTGYIIGTGRILSVSPKGKRITVDCNYSRPTAFYLSSTCTDGRKLYVRQPGAGIAGRLLNDRFYL